MKKKQYPRGMHKKAVSLWDYLIPSGKPIDILKGFGLGASMYMGYHFLSDILHNMKQEITEEVNPPDLVVELPEEDKEDKKNDDIYKYSSLIEKKATFDLGLGMILGVWSMYHLNKKVKEVKQALEIKKAYKVLEKLYGDYYKEHEDELKDADVQYKYSSLKKQATDMSTFYGAIAILSFLAGRKYIDSILSSKTKDLTGDYGIASEPKLVIIKKKKSDKEQQKEASLKKQGTFLEMFLPFTSVGKQVEDVFKVLSVIGAAYGAYKGAELYEDYQALKKLEEEDKEKIRENALVATL